MKNSTITAESIRRDRLAGSIDQTAVNQGLQAWRKPSAPSARITLLELLALAEARAGADRFPQYRGHYDDWEVVRITRRISTKMGEAFRAGDLTLARWHEADGPYSPAGWTAFSFRNGCDTGVGRHAVRASFPF